MHAEGLARDVTAHRTAVVCLTVQKSRSRYGEVVASPNLFSPSKNSTLLTVPSLSLASTSIVTYKRGAIALQRNAFRATFIEGYVHQYSSVKKTSICFPPLVIFHRSKRVIKISVRKSCKSQCSFATISLFQKVDVCDRLQIIRANGEI